MILQEIFLEKYGWSVLIFYTLDKMYLNVVIDELHSMGCSEDEIEDIKDLFTSDDLNVGFTISNFKERSSIIVIGKTDSAEQFNNTYDHEKGHLAMHICIECGINPFSEEYQYLIGDIAQQTFKVAKYFLCEECNRKLKAKLK